MAIQAVDASLDGGLLEEADVGGGLARLALLHGHQDLVLTFDHAEGVDDDFALHALNGVDYYGDLCVNSE